VVLNFIFIPTVFSQYDFDSLYKYDNAFKIAHKKERKTTDIYAVEAVMEITLEADFQDLIKRKSNDEYRDAVLKYQYNDSVLISRNLKIKPRGNMRKQICHFPPLKLNFPKKDVFIKELKDFDKIKMVGSCRKSKSYGQYLLAEYYVYKLYNILTEFSLRVRLLRVRYVDTSGRYKTDTRYAFIIEPVDELADRLDYIPIDVSGIHPNLMNPAKTNAMDVFQYMIGNTDYSVAGLHNVKLIKSTSFNIQEPVVIPYDFDYSGLVNTTYAVPYETLNLENVKERKFMGFCRTEQELGLTFEIFEKHKKEILSVYNSDCLLNKPFKKQSLKYLEEFYQNIANKHLVENDFLNGCRRD